MEDAGQGEGRARVQLHAPACLTVQRPVLVGDQPCTRCADACPSRAIRIGPRRVEIAPASCTGCGHCAAACPTGALTAQGFELLQRTGARAVECSRVAPQDRAAGAAVVACLGGLTRTALRSALLEGDVVLMDRGWCADCPVAESTAPWAAELDELQDEAARTGHPHGAAAVAAPLDPARAGPPPQAPAPEARSRRGWVAHFARAQPAAPAPAPPAAAETPALTARRDALRAMAGGDVPAGMMPQVTRDCARPDAGFAARLCPTGALALVRGDGVDRLVFDAARCIACGDCEAAGFALRAESTQPYAGPVTVAEIPVVRCARCRMRFRPDTDETTCAQCAKDDDIAALAHGLMRRRG